MFDAHEARGVVLDAKRPKATVILPVYNGEKYLRQAIDSVLAQSFSDFELLLLDDGSRDGSLAILDGYAKQDARCVVHSWPNRGVVLSRNEGIRLARAETLFFLDQDDICRPHRFERQLAFFESHPDCVAVGTWVMLIDPEGLHIRQLSTAVTHEEIDEAHLALQGGAIVHSSVAMRKETLVRIGGFREGFLHAEDFDTFLRLAEFGRLGNVPEILLEYRVHSQSAGHSYPQVQRDSAIRALLEARKRRKLPAVDTKALEKTEGMDGYLLHSKWAWWALNCGNLKTARKHALKAFWANPFDIGNLRLLACTLRGH